MKFFLHLFVVNVLICSCSKDSGTHALTNYSGQYHGTVRKSVSGDAGAVNTQSYEMRIEIYKTNNREIEILFGSWLTKAVVINKKFTIKKTVVSGPITISGYGIFLDGNKLEISYSQNIADVMVSKYAGTLIKF